MVIIYRMINFFRLKSCTYASFIAALLLFYMHAASYAAEKVEKIHINADHMRLNMETGYSIYTGNVKISQGELVLTGDKVTLKQNKDNEIETMTVFGKPARYHHITEKGEPINAESERMDYNASQNQLTMTTNARLHQSEQTLSSQKIVYDTLKKIIIAGGKKARPDKTDTSSASSLQPDKAPEKSQRVNITLTPKKQLLPEDSDKKPQ